MKNLSIGSIVSFFSLSFSGTFLMFKHFLENGGAGLGQGEILQGDAQGYGCLGRDRVLTKPHIAI